MGQGSPFPCDGRFFVAGTQSAEGPSVILSAFPDAIGPALVWDTVLLSADHYIGPIGFSVWDNYLYALDTATYEVLKIDAEGAVTLCGSVADDIDTSLVYQSGCVTPTGIKFVIVGRDPQTGSDETIYDIRINRPGLRVGTLNLVTQQATRLEDIAYDPVFGVLYGFDGLNRRLVQIGGGLITGYNYQAAAEGTSIAGLFFDRNGQLYGYGEGPGGNGKDNSLFSISKASGQLSYMKSILQSTRSDACACPFTIRLQRQVSPASALPCDTVKLVYRITNHSGYVYRNIEIRDELPDGFTLGDVLHKPFPASLRPASGDSVRIFFSDLPLLTDSVVFELQIDKSMNGAPLWQPAVIDSFPLGLGYQVFSDSAPAAELDIATLELSLMADSLACFGEEILLQTETRGTVSALSYRWSDGSTGSSLSVSGSGQYWVEVSNGCLSASDSILVSIEEERFEIQLPDEIVVEEGEGVLLHATVNGEAPFTYRWAGSEVARLNCETCASPLAMPLEDVTIVVEVVNRFGCTSIDSVRLLVNKIRDVRAANVFTPNGDGIEDQFFLIGEASARILSFSIVDRWGRNVYLRQNGPLNDPGFGWDGRFGHSQEAVPGVYFWVAEIEYGDESRELLRGTVTLIR